MGLLRDLAGALLRDDIGTFGEALTEAELKWAKLFGKKGITLRNIYLPKDNGETSEIDLVYITQKGIFVIESKNYSGWIFGDEFSQFWTQSLPNKQKNRFYNPVRQNRTHIKWLKEYLGGDIFCYSIIVFSNRCELKKVQVKSEDLCVIKRDDLSGEIIYLWKKLDDSLDETQIQTITEKLRVLTNVDDAVKQAHIEDIARKQQPAKPQPLSKSSAESADAVTPPVCPKCGAPMILRTAKKGTNAGRQFYGCSAFPKCRAILATEAAEASE